MRTHNSEQSRSSYRDPFCVCELGGFSFVCPSGEGGRFSRSGHLWLALWGGASVHSSSAEAHEAALDAAGRVTPVRLGGSGWFINPGGVPRAPRGVIGLFCTLLYSTLLYFTLLYFTLKILGIL